MPASSVVIWASAVGLIGIMGGIIAWLINKGFDTVKASIEREFKVLWTKLNEFQTAYNATAASLQAHKEAEEERKAACLERHRKLEEEQRSIKEELEHLKERRGDRRHAEP